MTSITLLFLKTSAFINWIWHCHPQNIMQTFIYIYRKFSNSSTSINTLWQVLRAKELNSLRTFIGLTDLNLLITAQKPPKTGPRISTNTTSHYHSQYTISSKIYLSPVSWKRWENSNGQRDNWQKLCSQVTALAK